MKKLQKRISDRKILVVKIDTADNYFSITGSVYEKLPRGQKYLDYKEFNGSKFEFTTGGCIHDIILKYYPKLEPIVNLHLSDLEGKPMHYLANGTYHFNQDKQTGLDYWRVKEQDRKGVDTLDKFILLLSSLMEQWKQEAKEGLEFIASLEDVNCDLVTKKKNRDKRNPLQYKGFVINYIRGSYRAEAYANPQFTETNLTRLKKLINDYLKS